MKISKIRSLFIKIMVCILAVVMFIPVIGASAVSEKTDEIGYETYTYWYDFIGKRRKAVYSKPMYEVEKVFTSAELGTLGSSSISDVHTTSNGMTYVLDGGESIVKILDAEYNIVKEFSYVYDDDENNFYFSKAKGIFADNDGNIYIADTNHSRVMKCDSNGKLIRKYTLPDSHLIPSGFIYQPVKVAVDNKGYVYILSNGSYYGAILYSPEDEFLGFYGSNDVPATVTQALLSLWNRLVTTNAQRAGMASQLPYTFTDLWIDKEDFVYTATGSTRSASQMAQIKRLNPGGDNILDSGGVNFADEGLGISKMDGTRYQDLMGVATDNNGFIHIIDATYGRVFIYDNNCRMISAFGGGIKSGQQDGTFHTPSAIAYNTSNDDIIISDSYNNTLTVFRITDYGKMVKSAQAKTIVGDYEEAMAEWTEVLALDRNCQLAYSGLAKAYYVMGHNSDDVAFASECMDKAISLSKEGYDRDTYSLAFGSVRTEWLRNNFGWIMLIAVLIIAVVIFIIVYSTKHSMRLIKNEKVHLATTIITHPVDNFREIKEKNLVSIPVCLVIMVLYYVFTVMSTTMGGFAFVYFDPSSYNSLLTLATTVGAVILWTVANWAVCTLFGGKGKAKEIFAVYCYSLIPSLIYSIIYVVCTNILVPEEAAFLAVLMTVCQGYTYILLIFGTMTIHDYSFGKFVGTTLLTLVGCGIVIFLLVTVGVLMQQTWGFIATVYSEILKLF
jgi:hypothetical protein